MSLNRSIVYPHHFHKMLKRLIGLLIKQKIQEFCYFLFPLLLFFGFFTYTTPFSTIHNHLIFWVKDILHVLNIGTFISINFYFNN